MAHDPIEFVVGKLRAGGYDPREAGPNQWRSRCPGHNGASQNLSVKRADDGTPLLHCHHADQNGRSCSWHDILRGLNVTSAELYGKTDGWRQQGHQTFETRRTGATSGSTGAPGGAKPRYAYPSDRALLERLSAKLGPVAGQWSYTDLAGTEVFRIVRLQTATGKTFRPIHRTADGWLVGDPPGLRPLYGLPALAGASRVFITEGEKAAEAVRKLPDLVATTSAHGAKSPAWTDWGPLAGKEVVILPDNDTAGAGYSALVIEHLARLKPPPIVRVVPLEMIWKTDAPIEEGYDIVDWLRTGVAPNGTPSESSHELVKAAASATVIGAPANASAPAARLPGAENSPHGPTELGARGGARAAAQIEKQGRDRDESKESTFDILMRLAKAARLTRTSDGRYYAEVTVSDHREAHSLHSKEFRNWLTLAFYKQQGHAPAPEAVKTLTNLLEAMAAHTDLAEETHVRVAMNQAADSYYLDLGDPSWRAVEIDRSGWKIVDQPPVTFRRPKGMLPLPLPARGGSIHLLKKYINLDETDFPLLAGVLTLYMRPLGPFPITIVGGEQGSAKSTLGLVAKFLIDPNAVSLRPDPKDGRDLMIGAFNSWLLCFDNISSISNALSDDFCRLATRGSHTTRQLYADDEESIISATRPVIINGIDEFARRSDFLDRGVNFQLPAIADDKRCYEEEFWRALEADRPLILGALLDGLSGMMRLLPEVHLEKRPRMADAARAGEAACRAHGWPAGTFLTLYLNNRHASTVVALENCPVARAITRLAAQHRSWTGTSSELLDELTTIVGDKAAEAKSWPKSARWLSTALRRTTPQLRMVGITVDFDRSRDRLVTITGYPKHGNSSVDSVDSDAKGPPY